MEERFLFDNEKPVKSLVASREFFEEANQYFSRTGYSEWRIVKPVKHEKHVCRWRSICETLPSVKNPNGSDPYCICGKVYNDPIHFTAEEYEALTIEEKIFT